MLQLFHSGGTGSPGLDVEKTARCDGAPADGATGPVVQPAARAAAATRIKERGRLNSNTICKLEL
jgi:hypothetical protein